MEWDGVWDVMEFGMERSLGWHCGSYRYYPAARMKDFCSNLFEQYCMGMEYDTWYEWRLREFLRVTISTSMRVGRPPFRLMVSCKRQDMFEHALL